MRAHGREQTYLVRDCHIMLSIGDVAVRAYVMPKYKLHWAHERKRDMERAMMLALAVTEADIKNACLCPERQTYHVYQHMYIRYTL